MFELLVVNHHYFRETSYQSGIYPVNKSALDRQLDFLHRQGYEFASQEQLASWIELQAFPDTPYCLLTFDDGLLEQMEAFEWLWKKGVPAIFFAPVNPVRTQKVLPVHRLHFIRTCLDDASLLTQLQDLTAFEDFVFNDQLLENQYRYDTPLARRLKFFLNFVMRPDEKERIIGQLFEKLVPDEAAFSRQLYMGESDLCRLAGAGALGSHGSAHLPLATLPEKDAEHDMIASIDYLEGLTGKALLSFSYPYGGAAAVNRKLGQVLQKRGLRFAFTMERGVNKTGEFREPFYLRRIDTKDLAGWPDNAS